MLGSDDATPTVRTPIESAPPSPDATPHSDDALPPPAEEPPRPAEATPPPGAPPPLPPAWQPPPADHGRAAPMIAGVVILVIGLWFFATQTLGLDLPRLDWRELWPVILIVLGIWVVARSFGRARDR